MSLKPFQKVCGMKTDILSNNKALFPSHPMLTPAGMVQRLLWVKLLVPYHLGEGHANKLYWQALASSTLCIHQWMKINVLNENLTVILLAPDPFP